MNVLIIGAGGHGRVVLDVLRSIGKFHVVGFIDADAGKSGAEVMGIPILGPIHLLQKLRKQDVRGAIVAIGDNRIRRTYADQVLESGLELITAIHPSAVISQTAKIGRNVLIAPGAIVGTEATIADDVIINTGAVVDHECQISRAAHIAPAAALAGRVEVGEGAFIGIGAKIVPCMKIGANAIGGAGAVVLEDVPAGATVAGVPAKIIKADTGRH
ncbi:MAG TPA: NeuD/PglB/VioB family sugar acetyltransferase, partial [Tepidisphaeraceae bacterium]|nr:NeuD/PglB/VioB family sugar acetyltransferase [Tepidisphaeraceae bacterium]